MRIFRSFKQLLPTEKNLDKTLTQTADINSGCKLDKAAYATKNTINTIKYTYSSHLLKRLLKRIPLADLYHLLEWIPSFS